MVAASGCPAEANLDGSVSPQKSKGLGRSGIFDSDARRKNSQVLLPNKQLPINRDVISKSS